MSAESVKGTPDAVVSERKRALAALGDSAAGGRTGLVYETTAAKLIGVAPRTLRLVCRPVETVPNPHRRSIVARLYDPRHLEAIRSANVVEEARARRGTPHKPRDYVSTFVRKYESRKSAIPDAAEALFSLNRHAKRVRCRKAHREEIYELKSAFIERLCAQGFLSAAGEHSVEQPARTCWTCEGDGCERCDDTGNFLPARTLVYAVLQFVIAGRTYIWHQPSDLVSWSIPNVEKLPHGDWAPLNDEEKPVAMHPNKFARAKALIRWVVEEANQ
jgi:hypothetical protein